jgi:riboflavin synthase
MFTWIITHQTTILTIDSGTFTLEKPKDIMLHVGQSVAHDGACMTVIEVTHEIYSFFVMQESFSKTNFWKKKRGDTFNLELCVQASSMLDGHIVTGHVDTTGTISAMTYADDWSKKLTVSFDPQRDINIIPKWSITLNGVSLTVVEVWSGRCTVRLIPLTQQLTNLWTITQGDTINIEFDMLGKYVLNYLKKQQTSL